VAIDPKGVVGELEYEIGAILRNPVGYPDVFASISTIERRVEFLVNQLSLNFERVLRWTFAQAVLSAIWEIEDGQSGPSTDFAAKLRRLVESA
jgi:streptomycin 6-kinase